MFLSLLQLLIIINVEEKPIFNMSHRTIKMLTTSCKVTPDTVYGEIVVSLSKAVAGFLWPWYKLRCSSLIFHDNGALARRTHLRSQSSTTLAVPYVHRFISTFPQSGRFSKVILRRSRQSVFLDSSVFLDEFFGVDVVYVARNFSHCSKTGKPRSWWSLSKPTLKRSRKSTTDSNMVNPIKCSLPLCQNPIDLVACPVPEKYATNDEAKEVEKACKPFTVVLIVVKTLPLHHMLEHVMSALW